ncbi:MAG: guanylate kinase [Solitalea-like symbiont of Acarus siro]
MVDNKKIVIISAPSGAGKTTLVKHLLSTFPNLKFSVSATTRKPRADEVHGKDYYFLSQEEFLNKVTKNEFIEFEEVYKNTIYGTLKSEVDRIWQDGMYPIFDVDVAGGLKLKKYFLNKALLIFILPPSIEILKERILNRGQINANDLEDRLKKAEQEIGSMHKFDIIIENKMISKAFTDAEIFIDYFLSYRLKLYK